MSSFVLPPASSLQQHRSPFATTHGVATTRPLALPTTRVFPLWKLVTTSSGSTVQCNAISTGKEESVPKRNEDHVEDDTNIQKETIAPERVRELVESIKYMLRSMDGGAIRASPYNTAWVAMVKDIRGSGVPQFPESLDWISNNQLADGSWGDSAIFMVYDRILCTLACVVALKSWNMHPDKIDKGILFIKQNIQRLENEDVDHMPCGFEVVFPTLLEMTKKLEIDIVPAALNSHGFTKEIYAARDLKLNKYDSKGYDAQRADIITFCIRYWTNKGIGMTRNCQVEDIDDTAMGFRLMRMHGYDISPEAFENFKKDGEFVCYPGQSFQAVTVAYNIYRASQMKFPGENILSDAADYAVDFLMKRRAENQLLDKWIITKDLAGEVSQNVCIFLVGILFLKQNIQRLENEDADHMLNGFEVVFPGLLEMAKKLQLDIVPAAVNSHVFMKEIYAARDLKLNKITKEMMHKVPTSLLFSIEGMSDLMWEKLMKFQNGDGSFLSSSASTAYALDQTKDDKCLKYIQNCVRKFNGGAPNVYPVDLFESIWIVDRLQRLGISRYFQSEIHKRLDYVHRCWTNKGIGWTIHCRIEDFDNTVMGFRLMRMHGRVREFQEGREFVCYPGQSFQSVTVAYIYRASQMKFPGENILCEAADYAVDFLMKRRAENQLLDKWIITKDLPGEVGYGLDVPWYASLPRLEARFYLEHYGGDDDAWIGKTIYRMFNISNNTYLETAKLDYNHCQDLHLREWKDIQRWYKDCDLEEFGLSERSVLQGYYIAAACVFEPERREERLTWAKTAILVETIVSYFEQQQLSWEQKRAFVQEFEDASILKYANGGRYKTRCRLVGILSTTLNRLSMDILMAHGQDIHPQLSLAWHKWLKKWEEGDAGEGDAELFVRMLNLCRGVQRKNAHMLTEEVLLFHPKYEQLLKTTKTVCHQLRLSERKEPNSDGWPRKTNEEIESNMQELLKLVFTKSPEDLDSHMKENFLTIAKSFYYASYFSPMSIDSHIDQVLFERVL